VNIDGRPGTALATAQKLNVAFPVLLDTVQRR